MLLLAFEAKSEHMLGGLRRGCLAGFGLRPLETSELRLWTGGHVVMLNRKSSRAEAGAKTTQTQGSHILLPRFDIIKGDTRNHVL